MGVDMSRSRLLIVMCCLSMTSILWSSNEPARSFSNDYFFLLLNPGFTSSEARDWIQSEGGNVTLMVNPNALIAKLDKLNASILTENPQILKVYLDTIPETEISTQFELVATLMRFFNELITDKVQENLEKNSLLPTEQEKQLLPDALPSPEIDYQSYLLNLERKKVTQSRFLKSSG